MGSGEEVNLDFLFHILGDFPASATTFTAGGWTGDGGSIGRSSGGRPRSSMIGKIVIGKIVIAVSAVAGSGADSGGNGRRGSGDASVATVSMPVSPVIGTLSAASDNCERFSAGTRPDAAGVVGSPA